MFDGETSTMQSTLHVRIQQHSGRKYLTIIEGIPADKSASTYDFLKKKLACGGANKKSKGIVQLMGDHSFVIKSLLKNLLPEYEIVLHGKKV